MVWTFSSGVSNAIQHGLVLSYQNGLLRHLAFVRRVSIHFGHVLGLDVYRAEKIGFDIEMFDKFITVVFTS